MSGGWFKPRGWIQRPVSWQVVVVLSVATALTVGVSACATTGARGVVRDGDGRPVAGATLALSAAGSARALVTGATEPNGCFSVLTPARRAPGTIRLTVAARGYQGVEMSFTRDERPVVAVTLAVADGPGAGAVVRLSPTEARATYEEPCNPAAAPGAAGLGVR